MLELFLIRVIDFFLYLFNFLKFGQLFIIFLDSVVIFDHHYTFLFVMPSSFRIFLDLLFIFTSNKKRFSQNSIKHHDIWLDSKKSGIIFFWQIIQRLKILNFFLKFIFHLVKIFLIFIKIFIVDILTNV